MARGRYRSHKWGRRPDTAGASSPTSSGPETNCCGERPNTPNTKIPPRTPNPELAGLGRLLALVENYLDFLVKHEPAGHAFLLMWAEAVASEPSIRPIYIERDQWFRQLIADLVADGITDGAVPLRCSPLARDSLKFPGS